MMQSGLHASNGSDQEPKTIEFFMLEDYQNDNDNIDNSILISGDHIVSVPKRVERYERPEFKPTSYPPISRPLAPITRAYKETPKLNSEDVKVVVKPFIAEETEKIRLEITEQMTQTCTTIKSSVDGDIEQIDREIQELQTRVSETRKQQLSLKDDIANIRSEIEEMKKTMREMGLENSFLRKELQSRDSSDIVSLNRHLRMKEPTRFIATHSLFSPLIAPKPITMMKND